MEKKNINNIIQKGKFSSTSRQKKTSPQPLQDLMKWAYMGNYREVISNLKEIALPERWYYKTPTLEYPYPILSKYLKYTFSRLFKEKNSILHTEKYAAFNTGLVNKLYEPIYAVFEKIETKVIKNGILKIFV